MAGEHAKPMGPATRALPAAATAVTLRTAAPVECKNTDAMSADVNSKTL